MSKRLKRTDLLFKEGDVLIHKVSQEKCIVGRIIAAPQKSEVSDKEYNTYHYSVSADISTSNIIPAEAAHNSLELVTG